MFKYRVIVAILGAVSMVAPAFADTVVTSPSGLSTSSGTYAANTWYANNVTGGASVGITNAYADNGNGSIQFSGSGTGAKADFEYDFSTGFALSSLTALSYDVYRSSSSSSDLAAWLEPAFRLSIYSTTSGAFLGSLVYEGDYNGQPVAPVDTFTTENILTDYFWASKSSVDSLRTTTTAYATTLAEWNALVPGGITVGGFTTGIGSGWTGSFDGAVDEISYATGGPTTTFNFEVPSASPVPEPSSITLLGVGLLVIGTVWMRRKNEATIL
jgi:hypothetical protein